MLCRETGSNHNVRYPAKPGHPAVGVCWVHVIFADPGVAGADGATMAVSEKITGVRDPDPAATVLAPGVAPNVNVVEASPWLFETTCVEPRLPPPPVTVNVTVAPETGLPLASVT